MTEDSKKRRPYTHGASRVPSSVAGVTRPRGGGIPLTPFRKSRRRRGPTPTEGLVFRRAEETDRRKVDTAPLESRINSQENLITVEVFVLEYTQKSLVATTVRRSFL